MQLQLASCIEEQGSQESSLQAEASIATRRNARICLLAISAAVCENGELVDDRWLQRIYEGWASEILVVRERQESICQVS